MIRNTKNVLPPRSRERKSAGEMRRFFYADALASRVRTCDDFAATDRPHRAASMTSIPQQNLNQLIIGYWHSQCVYVAAKLGIADHLANGPQTAEELAGRTGTHPKSLFRLLRTLSSLGMFAEEPDHRFKLTPTADLLRSDVPGSQRGMAIMMGEEHYRDLGRTALQRPHRPDCLRSRLRRAGIRLPLQASRASDDL